MTFFGVTEERYDELQELINNTILNSVSAEDFETAVLKSIKKLPLNEVFTAGGIYGIILWDFRHNATKPHKNVFMGPSAS